MVADERFVKLVVGNEFYYNALIHQYRGNRKASAPSPINALISLTTARHAHIYSRRKGNRNKNQQRLDGTAAGIPHPTQQFSKTNPHNANENGLNPRLHLDSHRHIVNDRRSRVGSRSRDHVCLQSSEPVGATPSQSTTNRFLAATSTSWLGGTPRPRARLRRRLVGWDGTTSAGISAARTVFICRSSRTLRCKMLRFFPPPFAARLTMM